MKPGRMGTGTGRSHSFQEVVTGRNERRRCLRCQSTQSAPMSDSNWLTRLQYPSVSAYGSVTSLEFNPDPKASPRFRGKTSTDCLSRTSAEQRNHWLTTPFRYRPRRPVNVLGLPSSMREQWRQVGKTSSTAFRYAIRFRFYPDDGLQDRFSIWDDGLTDSTNIQYVEYCIDVHGKKGKFTLSTATVRKIGTGISVNLFIFRIRKIWCARCNVHRRWCTTVRLHECWQRCQHSCKQLVHIGNKQVLYSSTRVQTEKLTEFYRKRCPHGTIFVKYRRYLPSIRGRDGHDLSAEQCSANVVRA